MSAFGVPSDECASPQSATTTVDHGEFTATKKRRQPHHDQGQPSVWAPMIYRPRSQQGGKGIAFHSLWVGKAGGELLRISQV
jgi:hypothetical protein